MPSRSMSPATVELTEVSVIPRAAAMLTRPAVRHAARACSRNSTGVGPLSEPVSTGGWSASKVNPPSRSSSWPAPKYPSMTLRLWVPLIQSLDARNWNFASSGWSRTASRVVSRAVVSTPLTVVVVVVVTVVPLGGVWSGSVRGGDAGTQLQEPAEGVGVAPGLGDPAVVQPGGEGGGEDLPDAGGGDAEEAVLHAGVGGPDDAPVALGDDVVDRPGLLAGAEGGEEGVDALGAAGRAGRPAGHLPVR